MSQQVIDNRYEIVQMLSVGSYAAVYKGFDNLLKKYVLIKLYNDTYSEARIDREFKILKTINHNNIVKVFNSGKIKNNRYIIYEYVNGITLDLYLRNNYVNLSSFIKYAKELISAIECLHSMNVLHRDIKPANIILDLSDDKLILLDFGISRLLDDQDYQENSTFTQLVQTLPNNITMSLDESGIGTPYFMAPEQFNNFDASFKSDLYSLGVVFYYMIFNELPFKSVSFEAMLTSKREDIDVNINKFSKGINDLLNELLCGMLKVKHDDRIELKRVEQIINEIELMHDVEKTKEIKRNENIEKSNDVFEVNIPSESQTVKVFDFNSVFTNDERKTAFIDSREFYRKYLQQEYDTLLLQAKVSFWLWVSSFGLGVAIIIAALYQMMAGSYISAIITALAEIFILIIQQLFKIREDYYRNQINKKTQHLEMGNNWNLMIQSIDLIHDQGMKDINTELMMEWLRSKTD